LPGPMIRTKANSRPRCCGGSRSNWKGMEHGLDPKKDESGALYKIQMSV
jgi:hypothetical protein